MTLIVEEAIGEEVGRAEALSVEEAVGEEVSRATALNLD